MKVTKVKVELEPLSISEVQKLLDRTLAALNETVALFEQLKEAAVEFKVVSGGVVTPPAGFKTDVAAVVSAFREYKKTHPRASDRSFSAKISNYATKSYSETFAEAFKDVSVNGSRARPESKLIMEHWAR